MRMDYSLFLRAAHGQLNISDEMDDAPAINHLDRRALKSFARFLSSRLLVNNFRWETNGLALRLPPVANRFLTSMAGVFMLPVSRNCSRISLGWDGTVLAHCGTYGFAMILLALEKPQASPTRRKFETVVEEEVSVRRGSNSAARKSRGGGTDVGRLAGVGCVYRAAVHAPNPCAGGGFCSARQCY